LAGITSTPRTFRPGVSGPDSATLIQARFATLDGYQTSLYLANVVLACLTMATILLPVSVHRRPFRQGLKATLVASADSIMKVSLAGVGLLSVGTTSLIFDFTLSRTAGIVAGLGLLAVLVLLLVFVPSALRRKGRAEEPA